MTEQRPIYLDYMATTPVDSRVAEAMCRYLTKPGCFGNPASKHIYGQAAAAAVEQARQQVAGLIQTTPEALVWTSGATESNNLAILGAARFYQRKGRHIITLKTEHKAALDPCEQLAREGFEVTYLSPEANGLLNLTKLADALRDDTILVSVMHVNNEIGVIQPIQAIGELLKSKGILFHVDAAQSAGKIDINLQQLPVDLMSFSAHKVYGPKGIGALFVNNKPRVRLQALCFGGGHERGMRSGTLATHQIVGMGEAFAIAKRELPTEAKRISQYRTQLWQGLQAALPDLQLNGDWQQRVPGNLNFSVAGVEGESLLLTLSRLAVSSTSACVSASIEPSYVLRALGVPDELAHSSIRLSIGRYTTAEEIDFAINYITEQVNRLRVLSPL